MKKLVLAALAASTAIASPAMAQSASGTVNITGNVQPKCLVVTSGGAATDQFTANVNLGNLAAADGTLATDLSSRFSANGGSQLQARVVCTSAAPTIAVDADPIVADTATAVAGYADTINYDAIVALTTVGANNGPFVNDSADPAGAAVLIGSRMANAATNVSITANDFRTAAPTDLLVADTYTGKITIEIAPGA